MGEVEPPRLIGEQGHERGPRDHPIAGLGMKQDARAGSGWSAGPMARRLRGLRLHLIDERQQLAELPGESRLIAHQPFLTHLRDLGRQRAQDWLAQHREAIGRRSTVDLTEAFG